MSTALSVNNLQVRFGSIQAVEEVSFDLQLGRAVALVGESGSGKSVTARALMGLSGGHATASELSIMGHDVRNFTDTQWRRLRGNTISMVLQDALMALDPLRPIGKEIGDVLKNHSDLARAERQERVQQILAAVGLPDPEMLSKRRSGQLSGGMRQRALIAQALISDPQIVIADEATTALDTRLTGLVLSHLQDFKDQGRAVVMISHDLAQVAQIADDIAVMSAGRIVEYGPAQQILQSPQNPHTQALLRSIPTGVPRFHKLSALMDDDAATATPQHQLSSAPCLEVTQVSKSFGSVAAVKDVSFRILPGQTLGLVGESGSGKTTTARLVLGLEQPDAGVVKLFGKKFSPAKESVRRRHRPHIGAVYQNPMGSFDPRFRAGEILADALSHGRTRKPKHHLNQVNGLLDSVHLPQSVMQRFPVELSGGQCQRLAIARALATNPEVLVLDEPVSALDVTIQAAILDLLDEIQLSRGTSYLFISHDLSVIEHSSDHVAVMKDGVIVELRPVQELFQDPQHPYTKELLQAQPTLVPRSIQP